MNMEARPVVDSPRIIPNTAGQPCYLVEYDEDQWSRYDKEQKEGCFEAWAKKAKPLGAVFVVLRLVPDALFPSGDKTVPYVARSYPVEQDTFNPIRVTCTLKAEIHSDTYANASDGQRMKLVADARRELAMHAMSSEGCSYEIWARVGTGQISGPVVTVLERGRL